MKATRLVLIIILFLGLANFACAQEEVKLHFINVGEGEAILIQAKNENILIDTGSLLSGYKLLDYLCENKVKKIKYLIITHPHPDHISGVFFILPKIQVQEVYDNGQLLDENDDLQRWYKQMARSKENYHILKKGDSLKLGQINLTVLWPAQAKGSSLNENSLVIMLNYNNFSCLFTADINNIVEAQLLKDKANLKANILKISHHGYEDATTKEFLEAVSPETAIISASPSSRIAVPSSGTLDLLKSQGLKVYRTDKDGDIEIIVQENGNYVINNKKN
jgi:competence protein ComEC